MSDQEKGNLSLEERITNFPKLLQDLDGGVIANVLGLATSNVARAVNASDKQGDITIKLKVKPLGTDSSMVQLTANLNVTEPKTNYGTKKEDFQYVTMAHVGKGGKLTYDKPKEDINGQLSLAEPRQLKEIRG